MATPPVLDADDRNVPVLDDAALADLARQFRGELIRAGDPPYEAARRVWNGAIDRRPATLARRAGGAPAPAPVPRFWEGASARRPGPVARCTGGADVRAAVRFARERQLVVAV